MAARRAAWTALVGAVAALLAVVAAGCGGSGEEGSRPAPADPPDLALVDHDRRPLELELETSRARATEPGRAREDVSFTAAGGADRVTATFDAPDGRRGGACMVVLHGLGSSRADLDRVVLAMLSGEAPMGFLALDARGHGDRIAAAEELAAQGEVEAWHELVLGTARDARRALDVLGTRPECDPDLLGVFGISLGGFTAPLVAGADYRLFMEEQDEVFPTVPRDDVDPARWVPAVAPRPSCW